MKVRMGVDVGGTFTDVVTVDGLGQVYFEKLPSTPEDQSIGVVQGILKMLKRLSLSAESVESVAHGTTVATNTLLERTGAVTALITTEGFRDVLQIGRQNRDQLYDLHARKTDALIPRFLRLEARERTLYTGEIESSLDLEGLKKTVRELKEQGVESIALCFLHSYVNPGNEREAYRLIRELEPELPVSLSGEILPEFREFERMNTTVMNAYIQPCMKKYISRLLDRMRENHIMARLTVMQSSGGMMTDQAAAGKCVNTLLSGPAGGVLAAEFLAKLTGRGNIITGDLGGTSFDVAVITDGKAGIAGEGNIEGFPVRFPHIDITTIGAGGGSVAWIDTGGALRVGPRSAGAVPGPVCYGKGGTEPTVTDAHAVLGRIEDRLLGGEMRLDLESARRAIREKLATPLGLSIEEAAEGILKVADANMVRAIRVMTVEKGIDPRNYIFLPYGGAGAMHAAELARALEVETVVVPMAPGNFSAFGLLAAPIRYDHSCTFHVRAEDAKPDKIQALFDGMEASIRQEMERDRVDPREIRFERKADLRYLGQAYELSVPVAEAEITAGCWRETVKRFHELHERLYGFRNEGNPVECVHLRLTAIGTKDQGALYTAAAKETEPPVPQPLYQREGYFSGACLSCAVYERSTLRAGQSFSGPAVVVEQGATTVVGPADRVLVDGRMNLVLTVASTAKVEDYVRQHGRKVSR